MKTLTLNGITIGFYPDEGDAGGTKSYLSDLNSALSSSWSHNNSHTRPAPTINLVGWYAQTYPGEEFNGFQLMPLVDDIKREYSRCAHNVGFIYEASVMPFQSWTGYTADNNTKALQVVKVMQAILDRSKTEDGHFAISEIRLRFGHEMNYYIKSGLYPPCTHASNPGNDFRTAFDQVAIAVHSLPSPYKQKVKMFWCPNIASTSSGAVAEYETYLPTLDYIDYVGIDYYCPSYGNLDPTDFVRKMKKVHDKYACATRPFILGETGLHFDENQGGGMNAKIEWLQVITGKEAKRRLPYMIGISWFNYEKDRDYRLLCVKGEDRQKNLPFVDWAGSQMLKESKKVDDAGQAAKAGKVKKFWKTLLAN
ncbi:uncharacterized protein MEPE_06374 [Melanopsichium pennsylvanicum]|uniref:GH26 domain-containing protein n=2 Tax=Melanopsichium pennsylvanicum TaxID=63383 RepID=A0AAJ4XSA3_9BASI|nr:uncharacterized protein MEPE_06374 [Melanopsichium pennsylvanicum]